MNVVTLTTSLGCRDPHLGALKAYLISSIRSLQIIDISNDLPPYAIDEAAYVLSVAAPDFPAGTVHLIGIDSIAGQSMPVLIKSGEHIYIGLDNGLISKAVGDNPVDYCLALPFEQKDMISPLRKILAPVVVSVCRGVDPFSLGVPTEDYQHDHFQLPVISDTVIKGIVTYLDTFGNAITNISQADLNLISRYEIKRISTHYKQFTNQLVTGYWDVPAGDIAAFVNTGGWLEIAINKGSAEKLLGIKLGQMVTLSFAPLPG